MSHLRGRTRLISVGAPDAAAATGRTINTTRGCSLGMVELRARRTLLPMCDDDQICVGTWTWMFVALISHVVRVDQARHVLLAPLASMLADQRRRDLTPHALGDNGQLRLSERMTHPLVDVVVLHPRLRERSEGKLYKPMGDGDAPARPYHPGHFLDHRWPEPQFPDCSGPLVDGGIDGGVRQGNTLGQSGAELEVREVPLFSKMVRPVAQASQHLD